MTERELIDLAFSMQEKAYVPYSNFPVGAALQCADGTIFTGCNVENAAYGSTICAERTAVLKAVTYGRRDDWQMLAVAGNGPDYCWPCGACLQMLSEFCEDLTILVAKGDRSYAKTTLRALLPRSFEPKTMRAQTEAAPAAAAEPAAAPVPAAEPVSAPWSVASGDTPEDGKGHFVLPEDFKDKFVLPTKDPALQQFASFFQDDWYAGDL